MKNVKYTSKSAEQTEQLGFAIGHKLASGSVLALSGPLGAGKTVLTKGIARGVGIKTVVTSPSFTMVSEHTGKLSLRHIDLYRTGSDEELELFGFTELTSGDGVTVIEWAEKGEHFLPEETISITIELSADGTREIEIHDPAGLVGGELDKP